MKDNNQQLIWIVYLRNNIAKRSYGEMIKLWLLKVQFGQFGIKTHEFYPSLVSTG